MEKIPNQAHFSKKAGQICMGKMKKTASTEIDFVLPNRDQFFKNESPIFPTSININKAINVPKGLASFEKF
jgi:hypothetical protein